MKILGLDSSGLVASVAIVEGEELIGEFTTNYKKTHSQTLLPMLDDLLKQLEFDIAEIDAIAISGGPGSFTGLRIGAATAKGLGLALDKPLIHIKTTEAMAYQLYGAKKLICPIMDARRNQVYAGMYRFDERYDFYTIAEQKAMAVEELIEVLNERDEPVVFLGDGVSAHREKIEKDLYVPYYFAPAYCNRQRASGVAALGALYYEQGKYESASEHKPDYLRESQAERERREREESQKL